MANSMKINLDLTPIILDLIARYGYIVAASFIFGFFVAILIALYFFKNPTKLQKLIATILSFLVKIGFKIQKTYIKLDIEGRVNDFIYNLRPLVYGYEPIGIKIKWVDSNDAETSFFDENCLVLVMRDSGLQNKNFVRAAMVTVAKTVLPKTRRYLSKSQAESVDLYIGKKLFEKEKPQVVDYFFEEFFDKKITGRDSIGDLVEKYNIMDKAGVFFPVFIQELNFLGEKVFYQKRTDDIIKDVNYLIDFLKNYAVRELGTTTTPLVYQGRYCRCGIVIIGRTVNIESGKKKLYTDYIGKLLNQKIENYYIISPDKKENIEFVNQVIPCLSNLQEYRRMPYIALVNKNGKFVSAKTHLVVLRSEDIMRYYDADYQKGYIENSEVVNLEEGGKN